MGQQMTRTIMQTISEKTLGSEKCVTEARQGYRRVCSGPPSIFIVQYVTGFVVGLIGPIFPPFMVLTVLVGCSRRRSACGSRGLGDGSNKHLAFCTHKCPACRFFVLASYAAGYPKAALVGATPNPQNNILICPQSCAAL